MKKKLTKLLAVVCAFSLFLPISVSATTLQDYINKVNKYQKEIDDANASINRTQGEISAAEYEIKAAKNEIQSIANSIVDLKQEIEDSNKEIKKKSLETKQIFEYYQLTEGENTYLEYIFGADSITDLIYRVSVVEQLTDHNDKVTKELEKLIEKNKKREKALKKKTKQLEQKQVDLQKKIKSLEGQVVELQEGSVRSSDQLKIYQDQVNYYKKQGCKARDRIGIDCAKENRVTGWYRPTVRGNISQTVGWTSYNLDGFHYGTDIWSSMGTGEKIYPIASGTISAITHDIYGAKIVIIYHTDANGKKWSSLYCHLSSFSPNIYVGMKVSPNTYIGYMGHTGYAFGTHLHLEVADCRLYDATDKNCATWGMWTRYIKRKYNSGFKGAKTLIKLPNSWSSR